MAWNNYLRPLWKQAKAWATTKVTEAVRETLTETPMFEAGRRAVPFVAAYVAASALLLSHALLSGTNISFASYVLMTGAMCIILLALLLLLCAPGVAADIPLMATVAYVPLLAMQCMLAAFATCVHQENRGAFAMASAVTIFLVVHGLVSAAFDMKFSEVCGGGTDQTGKQRNRTKSPADDPSDDVSDDVSDVSDDADGYTSSAL